MTGLQRKPVIFLGKSMQIIAKRSLKIQEHKEIDHRKTIKGI